MSEHVPFLGAEVHKALAVQVCILQDVAFSAPLNLARQDSLTELLLLEGSQSKMPAQDYLHFSATQ